MNLITQNAAAKLDYAPSKAYLSKIAKKPNRPSYFVPDGDRIYVDTDSDVWKKMINIRKLKKASGSITGGKGSAAKAKAKAKKSTDAETQKTTKPKKKAPPKARLTFDEHGETPLSDLDVIILERRQVLAKVEKAELETAKLRLDVKRKNIQLEMETKDLIEFAFAEYYFFSYMDKISSDMLRLTKKLKPQIVNFCLERDPEGLLKYLQKEIELSLHEVKVQQKKGLEEMEKEEDA